MKMLAATLLMSSGFGGAETNQERIDRLLDAQVRPAFAGKPAIAIATVAADEPTEREIRRTIELVLRRNNIPTVDQCSAIDVADNCYRLIAFVDMLGDGRSSTMSAVVTLGLTGWAASVRKDAPANIMPARFWGKNFFGRIRTPSEWKGIISDFADAFCLTYLRANREK